MKKRFCLKKIFNATNFKIKFKMLLIKFNIKFIKTAKKMHIYKQFNKQ